MIPSKQECHPLNSCLRQSQSLSMLAPQGHSTSSAQKRASACLPLHPSPTKLCITAPNDSTGRQHTHTRTHTRRHAHTASCRASQKLFRHVSTECQVSVRDAQVRWEQQKLSPSVSITRTEVTPLGPAETGSLDFCWWAARVWSSMSYPITFSFGVW